MKPDRTQPLRQNTSSTPVATGADTPTQKTFTITPEQRKRISEISHNPNLLAASHNSCSDLVEYGDAVKLEVITNDENESLYLETRETADGKFAKFLDALAQEDFKPGDAFLTALLQANITEIEIEPTLVEKLFKSGEALPLYEFSKKDSRSELTQDEVDFYNEILKEQFTDEIENHTKASKLEPSEAQNIFLSRIRRVLRINARHIQNDSLPRDLSTAWKRETIKNHKLSRRLFGAAVVTAFGLGTSAFFAHQAENQKTENQNITGKSIKNGDRFDVALAKMQIGEKLNGDESKYFLELASLVNKVSNIDEDTEPRVIKYSIPDNPKISKSIAVIKVQDNIHIRIHPELFLDYCEFRRADTLMKEESKINFFKDSLIIKDRG